jgi:hypothetical protein
MDTWRVIDMRIEINSNGNFVSVGSRHRSTKLLLTWHRHHRPRNQASGIHSQEAAIVPLHPIPAQCCRHRQRIIAIRVPRTSHLSSPENHSIRTVDRLYVLRVTHRSGGLVCVAVAD